MCILWLKQYFILFRSVLFNLYELFPILCRKNWYKNVFWHFWTDLTDLNWYKNMSSVLVCLGKNQWPGNWIPLSLFIYFHPLLWSYVSKHWEGTKDWMICPGAKLHWLTPKKYIEIENPSNHTETAFRKEWI